MVLDNDVKDLVMGYSGSIPSTIEISQDHIKVLDVKNECAHAHLQRGIEKPVIFISHILSDQATRWGIMELQLYVFVYCVKTLAPYLLDKLCTVRTDHRNL